MLDLLSLAVLALVPATAEVEDAAALQRQLGARYERTPTVARLDMWIDPSGKVLECAVGKLVGNEKAGEDMCRFLKRRKLKAAVGSDGRPSYGLYSTIVSLTPAPLDEEVRRKINKALREPDVRLQVSSLPEDAATMDRPVYAQIGSEGGVEACEAAGTQRDDYSTIVCEQISASKWPVHSNGEGVPTAYVTTISARFELSNASEN